MANIPELSPDFDQLISDIEAAADDTLKRTSSAPGTVLADGSTLVRGGVEQMYTLVDTAREATLQAKTAVDTALATLPVEAASIETDDVPLLPTDDGRVPLVLKSDGRVDVPGGFGAATRTALLTALGITQGLPVGGHDVFVVAGQSNSTNAYHDPAVSLAPAAGRAYIWQAGTWSQMGATGGFWSAFARAYTARTGRVLWLIPVGISGTSITTWQVGQSSHTAAITAIAAALAALPATHSGLAVRPVVSGVSWLQGESDWEMQSQSTYQNYLSALVADFRTRYGARLRWFLQVPGRGAGGGNNPIYMGPIRAAYAAIANSDAHAHLAAEGIETFPERGLTREASPGVYDHLHYSQSGYNVVGQMLASVVATAPDFTF